MDKYKFAELVAADFAASNKRFAAFKADGPFWDFLAMLFEKLIPLLSGCLPILTPAEFAASALENTIVGRFRRARVNRHARHELDDAGLANEMLHPLVSSALKVVAES